MKRLSRPLLLAILASCVSAPSAHASGFFGVLSPQISPVLISLSAASIRINESASASATGGSGDGVFLFSTSTPANCSINSLGSITPIATGTCTVLATRASSGTYLQRVSNPASLTITPLESEQPPPAPAQPVRVEPVQQPKEEPKEQPKEEPEKSEEELTSAPPKPTFSSSVEVSGTKALVTWRVSSKVSVLVTSRIGESVFEAVAGSEEGGTLEIPNLEPGYQYTIRVNNDDGTVSQVFQRSIAPLKVTRISGLSATKATNYAFIVKWQPQSYVEYYKIEITGIDTLPLTYYSKTPDFYLFDRTARNYFFAVSAEGEGGDLSDSVRFRASLTAPVNITSKLPTNPASNRLTTATSNQLKSIASRLSPQTQVAVTVYYNPKVKGSKKLAQTRVARAAATLKVTKSTLIVKTQVRKQISVKSLSQIAITTKAPARKLTLTNA